MARMLIVDDEPTHRQIATLICQRLGHVVSTAEDGLEALALLRAEPFDLAIVDMMMPGLDGFELVRRLKRDPATAQLPIVALTAAVSASERAALQALDLRAWVAKPFERRTLEHVVTDALARRPLAGAAED